MRRWCWESSPEAPEPCEDGLGRGVFNGLSNWWAHSPHSIVMLSKSHKNANGSAEYSASCECVHNNKNLTTKKSQNYQYKFIGVPFDLSPPHRQICPFFDCSCLAVDRIFSRFVSKS
jgi:hypothetical protein